jgi:hypothetical protein
MQDPERTQAHYELACGRWEMDTADLYPSNDSWRPFSGRKRTTSGGFGAGRGSRVRTTWTMETSKTRFGADAGTLRAWVWTLGDGHARSLRGFSDRDERKMLAPGCVAHVEINVRTWPSTDERMRSSARCAPRPSRTRLESRRSAGGSSMEVDLVGGSCGEGDHRFLAAVFGTKTDDKQGAGQRSRRGTRSCRGNEVHKDTIRSARRHTTSVAANARRG